MNYATARPLAVCQCVWRAPHEQNQGAQNVRHVIAQKYVYPLLGTPSPHFQTPVHRHVRRLIGEDISMIVQY